MLLEDAVCLHQLVEVPMHQPATASKYHIVLSRVEHAFSSLDAVALALDSRFSYLDFAVKSLSFLLIASAPSDCGH